MQTSFHHQPEAKHPKSPAIYTPAGRLPHLWVKSRRDGVEIGCLLCPPKADIRLMGLHVR
jgi:hypothetical protein